MNKLHILRNAFLIHMASAHHRHPPMKFHIPDESFFDEEPQGVVGLRPDTLNRGKNDPPKPKDPKAEESFFSRPVDEVYDAYAALDDEQEQAVHNQHRPMGVEEDRLRLPVVAVSFQCEGTTKGNDVGLWRVGQYPFSLRKLIHYANRVPDVKVVMAVQNGLAAKLNAFAPESIKGKVSTFKFDFLASTILNGRWSDRAGDIPLWLAILSSDFYPVAATRIAEGDILWLPYAYRQRLNCASDQSKQEGMQAVIQPPSASFMANNGFPNGPSVLVRAIEKTLVKGEPLQSEAIERGKHFEAKMTATLKRWFPAVVGESQIWHPAFPFSATPDARIPGAWDIEMKCTSRWRGEVPEDIAKYCIQLLCQMLVSKAQFGMLIVGSPDIQERPIQIYVAKRSLFPDELKDIESRWKQVVHLWYLFQLQTYSSYEVETAMRAFCEVPDWGMIGNYSPKDWKHRMVEKLVKFPFTLDTFSQLWSTKFAGSPAFYNALTLKEKDAESRKRAREDD